MKKKYICSNCGFKGNLKRYIKGSLITEIFLWVLFFPAGIIYSIWRSSTKHLGCPKCRKDSMIPCNTPVGQKLAEDDDQPKQ